MLELQPNNHGAMTTLAPTNGSGYVSSSKNSSRNRHTGNMQSPSESVVAKGATVAISATPGISTQQQHWDAAGYHYIILIIVTVKG